MTKIGGGGGGAKAPSLDDGSDDPNDPLATLQETIGAATLADTSGATQASPNAVDGENPLDVAGSTQAALDTKAASSSQKASDARQDLSSERSAKKTVGGRDQGVPQALGEKNDDEGSLSPAAIAAHIGRVRI